MGAQQDRNLQPEPRDEQAQQHDANIVTERVETQRAIELHSERPEANIEPITRVETQRAIELHSERPEANIEPITRAESLNHGPSHLELTVDAAREQVAAALARREEVEAKLREQLTTPAPKAAERQPELEPKSEYKIQEAKIIPIIRTASTLKPKVERPKPVVTGKVTTIKKALIQPYASPGSEVERELDADTDIIELATFRIVDKMPAEELQLTGLVETEAIIMPIDAQKRSAPAEIITTEVWQPIAEGDVKLAPPTVAEFVEEFQSFLAPSWEDHTVDELIEHEISGVPAINLEVIAKLQALETPEKVTEAQSLLTDILEIVQYINESVEIAGQEQEKLREQLESICRELFDLIGLIEYDDEQLEMFINTLLIFQKNRLATHLAKRRQERIDEGTHERDRHLRANFGQQPLDFGGEAQPEKLGYLALLAS